MKVVEYLVMDCPITGKVVARHYVDETRCNRGLRNLRDKGRLRMIKK